MSGVISAAVVIGGASMYASNQANKTADSRADAANANNSMSADRSRLLAEENSRARKSELLSRFNVKSGKIKDTAQVINRATANKLTNLDMQMSSARSKTDNTLATKHITGRVADRLRSVQKVQGEMMKDTTVQAAQSQTKDISAKLETLAMDVESEQMNLDIDLGNSINAANNAEVRGYTYSASTGAAGSVVAGISGAAQGASLGVSYGNYTAGTTTTTTPIATGGV